MQDFLGQLLLLFVCVLGFIGFFMLKRGRQRQQSIK